MSSALAAIDQKTLSLHGLYDLHVTEESRTLASTTFSLFEARPQSLARTAPGGQGSHDRYHTLNLLTTCRLLHHEAAPILYQQAVFHFGSVLALRTFFLERPQLLAWLRGVHLEAGPTKHIEASRKAQICTVTNLLANKSPQLKQLHLHFGPFLGVEHDPVVLGFFWLGQISHLPKLSAFSMDIQMNLPGPLGSEWMSA